MAETSSKKHTLTSSSGSSEGPQQATMKPSTPAGSATGYRIGAVVLWVVAIVFEILAILVLFGKINLTFIPQLWQLIIFLVLDLVALIIGSQLWKKANHIDPASKKNKVKFWLWNNMGVIVAAFAFIPFIILTLTDKNADKKTKTIATIAAVIALLIGGAASVDYNPVSEEEKAAAVDEIDGDVYWSPFGHVYHMDEDCSALNRSEQLTYGPVEDAIAANRTRLCSFCAKRHGVSDAVTTDKANADGVEEIEEEIEEGVDEEVNDVLGAPAAD